MLSDLRDRYFHQAKSCFFRWEERGEVLVWDDGTTIAFRQEIAAVMKNLAPVGLPPFHAIAVLLSACRGNWKQSRQVLNDLSVQPQFSRLQSLLLDRPDEERAAMQGLLDQLDAIHAFPEHLRSDLNARCELAAMIFEGHTKRDGWLDVDAGTALAQQMASGLPKSMESDGGLQTAIDNIPVASDSALVLASQADVLPVSLVYVKRDAVALLSALRSLQAGLNTVSADALERRLKTGLTQKVLPVSDDETQQSKSLLGQLLDDEQLGGLAKLARNLMALLTFPRRLSQPDDVAMGGVSDITNRGQLDRLLLSELAHDDLTLASRIALNEALYLHRETPPSPRAQHRKVLLDTGLCMWGLPRLFSTAVALSVSEMSDRAVDVRFFRADGWQLVPADFASRSGVDEHLGVLNHELLPVAVLNQFFDSADEDDEFVIVTDVDVAANAEFVKALQSALPRCPVFLVAVDRQGNISLSTISERGSRILRSGKVDLQSILSEPVRHQVDLNLSENLPLIFAQSPFPLRMYQQPVAERAFRYSGGLIMATGDGRLMLWDDDDCGARQLTDQLGKGRLFWYGLDGHGVPVMVWGFLSESALKLMRLHEDGYVAITHLTYDGRPVKVSGHLGNVFVEFQDRWEMFRSGRSASVSGVFKSDHVGKLELIHTPPLLSAASRFICHTSSRGRSEWSALTAVSGELNLVKVPLRNPEQVELLIDRRGKGIVRVDHDGIVQRLFEDERRLRPRGAVVAISIDGASFVQEGTSEFPARTVDVDTLRSATCGRPNADPFVPSLSKVCQPRSLRRKFRSICILDSKLVLRSPKGESLSIQTGQGIELRPLQGRDAVDQITFQPMDGVNNCLYTLEVAEWPCGSRAILDSRGLLHLVSSDPSVLQVSLILNAGHMAGWCEGQGSFGGAYFQLTGISTLALHDSKIYEASVREFIKCVRSH